MSAETPRECKGAKWSCDSCAKVSILRERESIDLYIVVYFNDLGMLRACIIIGLHLPLPLIPLVIVRIHLFIIVVYERNIIGYYCMLIVIFYIGERKYF